METQEKKIIFEMHLRNLFKMFTAEKQCEKIQEDIDNGVTDMKKLREDPQNALYTLHATKSNENFSLELMDRLGILEEYKNWEKTWVESDIPMNEFLQETWEPEVKNSENHEKDEKED